MNNIYVMDKTEPFYFFANQGIYNSSEHSPLPTPQLSFLFGKCCSTKGFGDLIQKGKEKDSGSKIY